MRNLHELNINEGGEPVRRPPPSDAALGHFERRFGLSVPDDLVQLLKFSNGGHPELNALDADGEFAVDTIYHLAEEEEDDDTESLEFATEQWRPILGIHALPFARDGGGNQFFLDLAASPPAVKICLHDEEFKVVPLAPSFEDFVARLKVDPDMI